MEPTTEQAIATLQDDLHDVQLDVLRLSDTIQVLQETISVMLSTMRILAQKMAEQEQKYEAPKITY